MSLKWDHLPEIIFACFVSVDLTGFACRWWAILLFMRHFLWLLHQSALPMKTLIMLGETPTCLCDYLWAAVLVTVVWNDHYRTHPKTRSCEGGKKTTKFGVRVASQGQGSDWEAVFFRLSHWSLDSQSKVCLCSMSESEQWKRKAG